MKGKLLDVKPYMYHALNSDEQEYELTIETQFLKRIVVVKRMVHDSVDLCGFIGKNVRI